MKYLALLLLFACGAETYPEPDRRTARIDDSRQRAFALCQQWAIRITAPSERARAVECDKWRRQNSRDEAQFRAHVPARFQKRAFLSSGESPSGCYLRLEAHVEIEQAHHVCMEHFLAASKPDVEDEK